MMNQCKHEAVTPAAAHFDEYLHVTAAAPQENIIITL